MVKIFKFNRMLELALPPEIIAKLAIIKSLSEEHPDVAHRLNILLCLDLVCLISSTYLEILRAL